MERVFVLTATGEAATEIAAFDNALVNAGIANMNLIYLSSVIPAKTCVEQIDKYKLSPENFGKRLYVVMAKRESLTDDGVAAGLGWVMEENGRFGLFVEHDAETSKEVIKLIHDSLSDMMKSRKEYHFSEIQYLVSEAKRTNDRAIAAIAVAVYQIDDWR